MESVENKFISLTYKLHTIEDGESDFVEEAPATQPFQFISGLGMALDAFEAEVLALGKDDAFDFTLPAAQAYGEYDEEHVVDLPKSIFIVDGKFDSERIAEGAVVPLLTAEGQRVNGSVVQVKDDVVVMDLNHPFAGCDLHFTGRILESRPATSDEITRVLRMMSGGGCGSCGGDCGGSCGGDCGGSCGGGCE